MKRWVLCLVGLSLVSHVLLSEKSSSEEDEEPDSGVQSHQDESDESEEVGQVQCEGLDNGLKQGKRQSQGRDPDQASGPKQDYDSENEDFHHRKVLRFNNNQVYKPGGRGSKRPKRCQPKNPDHPKGKCQKKVKTEVTDAKFCMNDVKDILEKGNHRDTVQAMKSLEEVLEDTEVNETTPLFVGPFVAVLHKTKGPFNGLEIQASENEAMSDKIVNNSKVKVRLPKELDPGEDRKIVFCMLTLPETNQTTENASDVLLYERRLVGLSVQGKNISGLQERVNITINLTTVVNEELEPRCVFLNFSTEEYSSDGCETAWDRHQSHITCSCDHLTYFGVLMVTGNLTAADLEAQTYITLVGCSLSLFALTITVLLFIIHRKLRADVSMKVHINLVVALILLNLHFLPSQAAAAESSASLCLYMALALHYSLLATFSWMALEGFHLYLLLVRVFNIYIRKYLLKLSVVGWGIPAIIVSVVAIIDSRYYGHVSVDSNKPDSTAICYIRDDTVKMVTTVGVFCVIFVFNVTMLGVAVRRVVSLRKSQEFGKSDQARAKGDIFTLLGVTTLLGIPWGVILFSFGHLSTAGLYVFSILNSLQGFFILLWFLLSLRKIRNSAPKTSSVTRSTNS